MGSIIPKNVNTSKFLYIILAVCCIIPPKNIGYKKHCLLNVKKSKNKSEKVDWV